MDISLPVVRGLLREALGFGSFTAGFIRSVTADGKVPTACINAQGDLRYNPESPSRTSEQRGHEKDLFVSPLALPPISPCPGRGDG